ncbi:hypothetical protein TSAR_004123 [Trichomalopsis sarcophagae]|uniref:Uncharacterized protein n=1 Tax=Trichomalopsis sarcophagae TaxID=543379 RepID=A0A232EWN5_9HYME|nr:hypothetical protein TSAR_004123 [Trichomalopsis sarcophagae]
MSNESAAMRTWLSDTFRVSAKPSPAVEQQQQQQEESSAESAGSQSSSFNDKASASQPEALVAQDSRSRPAESL